MPEDKLETRYAVIDPSHMDEALLTDAGRLIKEGSLVAFPTETVYGLGGDALNPASSRRIYAAKGRPSDNPLIVHIADMDHLPAIVTAIPEKARLLAEACWPGPLTMILPKADCVPYETTGGLDTVAVRMPSHPVARRLIELGGGYIAAPSANLSGRPSPTRAEHVREDLDGRIAMILDGGEVEIGLESTIVDFTEEIPVILRPGYLNRARLETLLGEVRMDPGLIREDPRIRPKAPGMRYRHYAPRADLTIIEGGREAVTRTINTLTAEAEAAGKSVGILTAEESAVYYPKGDVRVIGSRASEDGIARHLYAALRDFDADGVDVIYSEAFDLPEMGEAIMNRLLKAAGHKLIRV